MFQKDLFTNKTIFVTGGRSGIGFSIAQKFLTYGAKVFIAARKSDKLEEALEKLQSYGNCEAFTLDIRATDAIEEVISQLKEKTDRVDILINNAGGQFPSPAENISTNGWNAVINTNLNGTWYMTQAFAKAFFIPQKQGSIINIIANIYRGFAGMSHTGAARAGVDNLTKSLAVEWAKYGIQVNAVAPGIIHSTGLKQYPPNLLEGISNNIPMKRLGTTEEVADLVLFLSSPMAAYITGETIYIDGGAKLWGDVWKI